MELKSVKQPDTAIHYTHSGRKDDCSDWQPLSAHLHATAGLAAALAKGCGLEKTARLAALFHDLGKYDPAFDGRLRGENVHVDHSTAGAAT